MNYTPEIEFYKKRPFGDKLNATFVFLRENAKPYFKAQLLVAGPILLLITIIINQFSFDFMSMGFNAEDLTLSDASKFFKLYGLILISGVITGAIMPAVTYTYMKKYQTLVPDAIANSDITQGLAGKIFNLIGFNILIALIIGLVVLVFSLLIGFSATSSAFLVVIFGLGLIVLMLYFGITLSLGSSIIVFEDNNPIDAIGRCFRLIVGKWWSTFGLIVVVGILSLIINQLFGIPRAIFFGVKAFTAFEEGGDFTNMVQMTSGEQLLNVLFSVFETFGTIVTNSLVFIAIAFQYFNLVERKESKGLMSQIEGLDQASEAEDDEVY